MIVSVTRKHIAKARKLKRWKGYTPSSQCPIVLALWDAGFERPQVDLMRIRVSSGVFRLTRRMAKFIEDFDAGRKVKPTRFLIKGL